MKYRYIIITVSILLGISGLLIFLSDKSEQKGGDMATFRKNLLQIEPSKRDKVFNFLDGKRLERTLSFFFVCGGIFLTLITLFIKFPTPAKLILLLVFVSIALLSFFNLKKINRLVSKRAQIYRHGKTVTATVVSQSKKNVFYSSTPSYCITAKTNDTHQKTVAFCFSSKKLHNSCPKGKIIKGIEYKGDYFFGEMVGVELFFADENGEIIPQD